MLGRRRSPKATETQPPSPLPSPAPSPGMSMLLVPDLQPLRMWPCRYAKAADSLGFLKTIDHVEVNEVVKRQGGTRYVVDVFLKNPDNRIPTTRSSFSRKSAVTAEGRRESVTGASEPPPRDPDYQIEKLFSEFVKLRYNIWVHAQQPRPANGCIYCDDVTAFVGDYNKRPSSFVEKIWASKTHRKELMEAYVNRMVALAIGKGGDGQRSAHCHGFDHIPNRLVRFLKKLSIIEQLR
ncbi:hypothetical protein BBJ28_00001561 [Nothophytophthora sp. Chile5]|nr:hypothetical protein BBJ28_00001561 [Nothophytophthora sp. Chile5]